MSRAVAWYRKEWREHRAVVVAAALAVVLGCASPYVLAKWELRQRTADALPALALALAMTVFGLDLYAREVRRGTHALLLRTPGALRAAFLGKLAWFLSASLLVFLLALATCRVGTAVTGAPMPHVPFRDVDGAWRMLARSMEPDRAYGLVGPVGLPLAAVAVGVWHLVGSVWVRRGGAAALVGLLALCLACAPLLLLHVAHPWWFAFPATEAVGALALLGVAGVGIAAWCWGRGRRYLVPGSRALLHGLGILVALFAAATGAVAWRIDRWEAADPAAPELRIHDGLLGEGARHLFVTTYRGVHPHAAKPFDTVRSSPFLLWSVDLASGRAGVLGTGLGDRIAADPFPGVPSGRLVHPVPWVVHWTSEPGEPYPHARALIDARTGHVSTEAPPLRWPPRAGEVGILREVARAVSPHRDAEGRRVWCLAGQVEREGQDVYGDPASWDFRAGDHVALFPDGWIVSRWRTRPDSGRRERSSIHIDARTGVASAYEDPPPPRVPEGAWLRTWTSLDAGDGTWLQRASYRLDERFVETGWRRARRAGAEAADLDGPPLAREEKDWEHLGGLGGGLLLRADRPTGAEPGGVSRLAVWRPATDAYAEVRDPRGDAVRAVGFRFEGLAGDGRRVVRLLAGHPAASAEQAVGLLDPVDATFQFLVGWGTRSLRSIAVQDDGAYVAIEDDRRVVRFRDGGKAREVLFPR